MSLMAITQHLRIPLHSFSSLNYWDYWVCTDPKSTNSENTSENSSRKSRLFHWKPATQHSYFPEKLHFLISGAPGALLAGENYPDLLGLRHDYRGEPRFQLIAVSCGGGARDDLDQLRGDTAAFLAVHGDRRSLRGQTHQGVTRLNFSEAFGFGAYPTTYLIGA